MIKNLDDYIGSFQAGPRERIPGAADSAAKQR